MQPRYMIKEGFLAEPEELIHNCVVILSFSSPEDWQEDWPNRLAAATLMDEASHTPNVSVSLDKATQKPFHYNLHFSEEENPKSDN